MSTQYKLAKAYSAELGNDLTEVNMEEFFMNVHDKFFSDIDISFMKFFLELVETEGFIVHHSKLAEYGIMTSMRSGDALKKMTLLSMKENIDYRLRHMSQPVAQGGFTSSRHYYLSAKSFKKCLMRAKRHANQEVDPTIYCDYYLLLEDVYVLFRFYQKTYSDKIVANLEVEKENLAFDNKSLSEKLDVVIADNKELKEMVNSVVGHTKDIKSQLTEANNKLDEVKTITKELYVLVTEVITRLESNAFGENNRTQAQESKLYFELICTDGDILKIKIQYILVYLLQDGSLELYPKCTNIEGIYAAIKKVGNGRKLHGFLVIGLNLNEINAEQKIMKDIAGLKKRKNVFTKSATLKLVEKLRNSHLRQYKESNEIIEYVSEQDTHFKNGLITTFKEVARLFLGYNMPSKELLTERMIDVKDYVNQDFNDREKLTEIVREHGYDTVMKQFETLMNC
jgi:archaellum component FlaC